MLDIERNSDEYVYGKRDLLAAVISLKLFLPSEDVACLLKEISDSFQKIMPTLTVLNEKDILEAMGFPSNWNMIGDMVKA